MSKPAILLHRKALVLMLFATLAPFVLVQSAPTDAPAKKSRKLETIQRFMEQAKDVQARYDLLKDPGERRDIREENGERLTRLVEAFEAWKKEITPGE